MKKLMLISIMVSATGCATSEFVKRTYEPSKSGTVRYLNAGPPFMIDERVADAESKMKEFCGGPYRIISDSQEREDTGSQTTFQKNVAYTRSTSTVYAHVNFVCDGDPNSLTKLPAHP